MKLKGFTIVELIVIIAVIAILVTISTISYSFLRDDGLDSNIKTTVRTVGDAIQLHESQTNGRITGTGVFTAGSGVDATLMPKYLKNGYRNDLKSKNVASNDSILKWYNCADGSGGFVVYASLNNPSADDIDKFNSIRSSCGHSATEAPNSGANVYNYAQVF